MSPSTSRARVIALCVITQLTVMSLAMPTDVVTDVNFNVDWSSFLERHDMLWKWQWSQGATYTLQPISSELQYCGPNKSRGPCCLAISTKDASIEQGMGQHVFLFPCDPSSLEQQWRLEENGTVINLGSGGCLVLDTANESTDTPSDSSTMQQHHSQQQPKRQTPQFAGDFQIALINHASWDCSPTANPPRQCCLPVPDQLISGCHAADEKRWNYNQFFQFPTSSHSDSFQLALKSDATTCAAAVKGNYSQVPCASNDPMQTWKLITTTTTNNNNNNNKHNTTHTLNGDGAMIQNVGLQKCLGAERAIEAGNINFVDCIPSDTNVWTPLCDIENKTVVTGWGCTAQTPSPSPPTPSPPTRGNVTTEPCSATSPAWLEYEGLWIPSKVGTKTYPSKSTSKLHLQDGPNPDSQCLQIGVLSPFCESSICPRNFAQNFTHGLNISTSACLNGDRSQMISAYTLPTKTNPLGAQNFIPLTWAVSAYVGNGLVGVHVQSEEGGVGVLHVNIDNVLLGAYARRKANGYWRFTVADANSGNLGIAMRVHIANSYLEGNVTDAKGALVSSFNIFVNSDLDLPVVVLTCTATTVSTTTPSLEWVPVEANDFAWYNQTIANTLTAWASLQAPHAPTNASAVVAKARALSRVTLLANTTTWWQQYWEQSFVSVPVTRVEGFYYAEMYRFPASDRVTLHGLMGAFGPTEMYNLWPDDVWDMNEQVMYWIGPASNRKEISNTLVQWFEKGKLNGGLWMIHNYVKQARFSGNDRMLTEFAFPAIVSALIGQAGKSKIRPGSLKILADDHYHIVGCSSPEYHCYPPFESRACTPDQDCNYEISQLRWGLQVVLEMVEEYHLAPQLTAKGVDISWWQSLIGDLPTPPTPHTPPTPPTPNQTHAYSHTHTQTHTGHRHTHTGLLAWYPYDNVTGFRLDAKCAFDCPHRHFSHLLEIFDLETVVYDEGAADGDNLINSLIHKSIDNWYGVTCNDSNWFNEECRGFTGCGLASMNVVSARPEAAQGNLTSLLDTRVTPNGMYGEMVYQAHPEEFSPVSESAYCGAGVIHTMLLHTNPTTKVLSIFAGLANTWANASFHQLAASGGLVVSAARVMGTTEFVRIESNTAKQLVFTLPRDAAWETSKIPGTVPSTVGVKSAGPSLWSIALTANSPVIVYVTGGGPPFVISAVPSNKTEENWFGYTRQMQPLH